MNNNSNSGPVSGLVISDEVIASIALGAIKDVPGVGKPVPRPADMTSVAGLFEKTQKTVEVSKADNVYSITLHITVNEDAKIPVVAAEVQKAVKNAVQEMTSMVVSKVNVVIAGVEISDAPNQEKND
ncbi:MAG: Asp23/Gls24 family envelope stress response protein [Clostridia bacterium]|nr:Asp23/Gls24 family envelope stress response protein [Clostridia bacterium]